MWNEFFSILFVPVELMSLKIIASKKFFLIIGDVATCKVVCRKFETEIFILECGNPVHCPPLPSVI